MESERNPTGHISGEDQIDRGINDRSENNYYDDSADQYQNEGHGEERRHERERSRSRERDDTEQERGWAFEENPGNQVHTQEDTSRSGGASTSLYVTNLAFQV